MEGGLQLMGSPLTRYDHQGCGQGTSNAMSFCHSRISAFLPFQSFSVNPTAISPQSRNGYIREEDLFFLQPPTST